MPMQSSIILSNLNSFIKFFLGSHSPKGKIIFPQKLFGKFAFAGGGARKLGGGCICDPTINFRTHQVNQALAKSAYGTL